MHAVVAIVAVFVERVTGVVKAGVGCFGASRVGLWIGSMVDVL